MQIRFRLGQIKLEIYTPFKYTRRLATRECRTPIICIRIVKQPRWWIWGGFVKPPRRVLESSLCWRTRGTPGNFDFRIPKYISILAVFRRLHSPSSYTLAESQTLQVP